MEKIRTSVIAAIVVAFVFYLIGAFKTEILIPSNAVIAFDSPCPDGWDELEITKNKVIVGAGDKYSRLDSGGVAQIFLKEPNMPKHTHDAVKAAKFSPNSGNTNYAHPHTSSLNAPIVQTGPAGENRPIDNMQPWVALTYCRKVN